MCPSYVRYYMHALWTEYTMSNSDVIALTFHLMADARSVQRKPTLRRQSGANAHISQPKTVGVKCLILRHKVVVTGFEPMCKVSVGEYSTN